MTNCLKFMNTSEVSTLCTECKELKKGTCMVIESVKSFYEQKQLNDSIEFAEWKHREGYYGFRGYEDNDAICWCRSIPAKSNPIYTTKELYELWKTKKDK